MAKRKVSVSKETKNRVKGKEVIVSLVPVDRYDCPCQQVVTGMKKSGIVQPLECVRKHEADMKPYQITCGNCNSLIAYIHATDKKLSDWCNLHYVCENDGKQWKGCMAVNISPIDQHLGFECTCGNDTRDFRANTTLRGLQLANQIKTTSTGREFGKSNSKFKVKEIK